MKSLRKVNIAKRLGDEIKKANGRTKKLCSKNECLDVPLEKATLSEDTPEVKLVLFGEVGVGKTTFVNLFETKQVKEAGSSGVKAFSTIIYTNKGPIHFSIHVLTSEEVLASGCYDNSHGAIFMFDTTSRITSKNIPFWHRGLTHTCGNIPMVVVGNKKGSKAKTKKLAFAQRKSLQYFDISAKSSYNLEKPFLWLARTLSGDNQLHIVEAPALQPPEIQFEEVTKQKYEAKLAAAAAMTLPEEDDEDL